MLGISKIGIFLVVALMLLSISVVADIGTWVEQNNEYLLIQLGVSDHAPPEPPGLPRAGRWGVFTLRGDPETDQDDNLPITRPAVDFGPGDSFGVTTIRIDGRSELFGNPQRGGWVQTPYASDSSVGNYVGQPPASFHSGFYINSEYLVTEGSIDVLFRMALIRDQLRFEVLITNNDSAPHSVGLRHCADSTTNSIIDSISYPFIPGRGFVMYDTSLVGTDIPDYFEFYDDQKSPKVALRNTLQNMEDATPPDRVAVGSWQRIAGGDWDFTPAPDHPVSDYGWAVWWNPVLLNPGESRLIISYFGMAAASASWTSAPGGPGSTIQQDPFVVAVQGPRSLPIDYASSTAPEDLLQSNPFNIKAYVYNLFRDSTLTNVYLNLTLPEGLELVSGDATQEIDSITPETEGLPVTWEVKATGKVAGELQYIVSATGAFGLQKTVTRTIMIPATSTTSVDTGWRLMAVPFKFQDPRIEQALNLEPDSYQAYIWNTLNEEYDSAITVGPGKGFWLNSSVAIPSLTIASDGKPLSGADSYNIVLFTGWNQFANPFLYNIPWGRLKVLATAQAGPISIEEAAARNIIRQTIYWWETATEEYKFSSDKTTFLVPWAGYWIKALEPCELIIPKVEQAGGGITGSTTRSKLAAPISSKQLGKDGWKLNLVAKAGKLSDSRSMLGVDNRAADGYDALDVERPPSPGEYVAISFAHPDWGRNRGNYFTDIRRSVNGTQSWDFQVATSKQNTDVVLAWPNMKDVPKDVTLKLVDVDGNATKFMRTASSYRYSSGSGGVRRFRIVAERGSASRLLVTGLTVDTTRSRGSATISYNLSTDAAADVRIKNIGGRAIRTLAEGRGVTRGISTLSWNYRDNAGKSAPVGSYLIEVVATTPEGELVKAVRPFLVAR